MIFHTLKPWGKRIADNQQREYMVARSIWLLAHSTMTANESLVTNVQCRVGEFCVGVPVQGVCYICSSPLYFFHNRTLSYRKQRSLAVFERRWVQYTPINKIPSCNILMNFIMCFTKIVRLKALHVHRIVQLNYLCTYSIISCTYKL